MTVRYTCSDSIQAMARELITLKVSSRDEAFSGETWKKVKTRFARKHRTRVLFVNITGVEILD